MAEAAEELEPNPELIESVPPVEETPPPLAGTPSGILSGEQQRALIEQQQRLSDEAAASRQRQLEALRQRGEAEAPIRQQLGTDIQARQQAATQIPEVPQLPPVPKVSEFINKDQATALSAIGTIIAGFGAGGGRIRGIRANRALAGFVNGWTEGNLVKAQLALKEYREQIEQQMEQYRAMARRYQQIMDAKGMTIEDRKLQLELAGKEYGDRIMVEKAIQGDIDGQMKEIHDLIELSHKGQNAASQAQLREIALQTARTNLERAKVGLQKSQLEAQGGTEGMSEKERQAVASQIVDDARQEIEAPFKTGPLGAMEMSSLGKTPEERASRLKQMIMARAREMATQRGMGVLFGKPAEQAAGSPHQALLGKLKSGEISSSSGAVQYLQSLGIPQDRAVMIAAGVVQQFQQGK